MNYVYIERENLGEKSGRHPIYIVGFYKPFDGFFETDSTYNNRDDARQRVNYLNGGTGIDEDYLSQLVTDISNHLARR